MMNTIKVKDATTRMKEGYFSLTDIAKKTDRQPNEVIRDWLKNHNTLAFLQEWERANNLNHVQLHMFSLEDLRNDRGITISKYIKRGGTGIISSAGRTGGTYAHIEIALEFASWLDPTFKVWFFKEWIRMKESEAGQRNLEWHVEMLSRNANEPQISLESLKEFIKKTEDK